MDHATKRRVPMESMVTVTHECDEGWHTFTSEQVPGLFLTGREDDLQELYEGLPNVIAEITQADFGVSVVVSPEQTYSSYLETLPLTHLPSVRHYSIKPQAA